ncbi:MAG TPA: DNA gyrase subunit A [Candidatus Bilamarchaeaceae archaeon]|nr:DNA gyrase subunit A [Candidatus Bilamarchaeaceae archaeon]
MPEKIIQETIEQDMKQSYLDYAMSVIIGRAIPDARDGLKPVHRRVLYAMQELGNTHNKPTKKSARIVGETMGKYHPHGDAAIYDTLVRLAQDFSMRYTLVEGQGNFGSIDGDNAAHMRYTEVRLQKISEEMLLDLDKETVDFAPNFDGTLKEPTVLPSPLPNLLLNGSSGIAVGMATNIPPHNLNEIVNATIALIDGATEEKILAMVQGPDFPTGGQIVGRAGIFEAYKTGRGIIRVRGKAQITDHQISITEIPYQVTKKSIIEAVAEAVKAKRIEGISGIQDRSDKKGIEVVITLKRDADPEVVLNRVYAYTPLESTFGIINLALVGKEPKILGLYPMLQAFVNFRKEVVRRRSQFELTKAQERVHILEGLRIALQNIDSIVPFLKSTKDVEAARTGLMKIYSLSEKQANAVLDMKLQRLISLERDKIENEYGELQKRIAWLKEVLADVRKILNIIKEELLELQKKYGDKRRTEILEKEDERTAEELIPNDDVAVLITNRGYVKRLGVDEYRAQRRGGKGVISAETKEADFVRDIIVTQNHNHLLFFTDKGRLFWLKAYEIPEFGRYAAGKTIVNLLDLKTEKVTSWVSVPSFEEGEYLLMATQKGIVKRIALNQFSNPRRAGIIAITLKDGDQLVDVVKTYGKQDVVLTTKKGQSIRFNEQQAREIGRTGQGVIGIRLKDEKDAVVSLAVCRKPSLLTITENGYGKRTSMDEYRLQGRGGSGVINIKTEGRNGDVVEAKAVSDEDDIIVVSSMGQTIRIPAKDISVIGRNTQGVRIITLKEGEKVSSFAVVQKEN